MWPGLYSLTNTHIASLTIHPSLSFSSKYLPFSLPQKPIPALISTLCTQDEYVHVIRERGVLLVFTVSETMQPFYRQLFSADREILLQYTHTDTAKTMAEIGGDGIDLIPVNPLPPV